MIFPDGMQWGLWSAYMADYWHELEAQQEALHDAEGGEVGDRSHDLAERRPGPDGGFSGVPPAKVLDLLPGGRP